MFNCKQEGKQEVLLVCNLSSEKEILRVQKRRNNLERRERPTVRFLPHLTRNLTTSLT